MLAYESETGIALDIPLRGSRDYVHSTDLFAALDDFAKRFLAPPVHLKNLTLRHRAHQKVEAHFTPRGNAFGTFTLAMPGRVLQGWLVEGAEAITRRIAFDEAAIAREAVIGPNRAFLSRPVNGYSRIEEMVVLFKLLCAQDRPGAWLITAIDLDRPFAKGGTLAVSRTQTVLDRMVDAVLQQNDQTVGRARMVLPAKGDGK